MPSRVVIKGDPDKTWDLDDRWMDNLVSFLNERGTRIGADSVLCNPIWKEPVATACLLPAEAEEGEARLVEDEDEVFHYSILRGWQRHSEVFTPNEQVGSLDEDSSVVGKRLLSEFGFQAQPPPSFVDVTLKLALKGVEGEISITSNNCTVKTSREVTKQYDSPGSKKFTFRPSRRMTIDVEISGAEVVYGPSMLQQAMSDWTTLKKIEAAIEEHRKSMIARHRETQP